MRDRVIIYAIAVSQFLLSLAMLGSAYVFGPFILILGLWGLMNACALVTLRVFPRISGLLWHLVFVGYVLVGLISGLPDNQSYRLIQVWAAVDLTAAFYLAKTILKYMRNRTKSET